MMPTMGTGKRQKMNRLPWFLIASCLLLLSSVDASKGAKHQRTITSSRELEPASLHSVQHQPPFSFTQAISIRGGAEDEGEESAVGGSMFTGVLVAVGKTTLATLSALQRAIFAAFESEEVQEEENRSAVSKIVRIITRMWNAAMDVPDGQRSLEEAHASERSKSDPGSSSAKVDSGPVMDFGGYLSRSYGVSRGETSTQILGGNIGDALRDARSKARLLLVFIPGSTPSNRGKKTSDQSAIHSLLSQEVTQVANKPARKKATTGSYLLWGAKASSPEAVTAMKRLKVKQPKGEKRPTLVVAYPAQVLDGSGQPKLIPRMLAQHHCSPPPNPESMAAWLNALRKRHAKQFASMQHELNEVQLHIERQQGYRSSIQDDLKRQEQEKREKEDRLAKEAAEQARQEQLTQRRIELTASLPEEPPKEDSFTIALRFANGKSGQRRFKPDTPLTIIFNWVDAVYELERELVMLTTMNGQKAFTWDKLGTLTLQEAGLGRMTGLRVSETVVDKNEAEEKFTL